MRILIVISFVLVGCFVFGQTKNEIIQERIEFIAQDLEIEDIALEDIFDILDNYYDNKLNVNTASKEDLEELIMLNDFQIQAILSYRDEHGLFTNLFELSEVPLMDMVTLNNIYPFIQVVPPTQKKQRKFGEYLKEGNFEGFIRYIRNIEDKAGYAKVSDAEKEASSKYYWGDPSKVYSRLRYTHKKDLSVGVTMSKDPGEQLFGKTQPYGFDFYSGHFYYDRGKKFFRKVVVGDYQVQIGQGLAFWTGYGFSKTAESSSIRKKARGLRPYTSTDEARFMRGAGVEMGIKDFSLTTWVSYKGVDGTVEMLDTLEDEEARMASSINQSGYHRTINELEKKHSIKELIYGANLKYETRNFQVGVSAIQQAYDTYFKRRDQLMNKYQFEGKDLLNLSADYSYIINRFSLFGEVAYSGSSGAFAFLQGASVAVGRQVTLSALYRYYPKDYHTFYSRGFGDGSNTINESGIYLGGNFKLSKEWSINSYVDLFQSPWLKFGVDGPSHGYEVLGQLKYRPSPRLEIYFRAREKEKMQNEPSAIATGNIKQIETYKQRKFQLNFSTALGGGWQWKSRIDYVTDQRKSKGLQHGYALTQDVLYRNAKFPLEVSLRYSIFNTDSYDTRLYIYEYNMQNVFSIPTYYMKGSRSYVMLRYSFLKHFDLWLRYGIFIYHQEDSISSGPEEIQGNIKSEVGLQLKFRF